ncbi:AraC family transcriptional regulator [Dictyobacter vulcani]|uniref:AraC family transcriptional regulator n=1 Tax=Dictyobacter vulcani TaxID=2607529 RepID=A0A5J4KR37_9CHLR|nr:AraC family transcriptional regulator [Dictyobacter vulcani]GER92168.1 AraC family transcriptional regulator [Dictyobacter vulcani]
MFIHHHAVPALPLAAFIENFWMYAGEPPTHMLERRLPDGLIELIINLHADQIQVADLYAPNRLRSYPGAIVRGAHAIPTFIATSCMITVMGVQFKSGGALPFLSLSASELCNQVIALEDIWGETAHKLYEQLQTAIEVEERFAILEHALCLRLNVAYSPHPSVPFALTQFQRNPGSTSIARIVGQLGISQKHFIQVFRDATGLAPKQFCRIQRFQQLLRSIANSADELNWTQIALDWGYFDQSHLIHDFQNFAGLAPGAYLAGRSQFHNHVPLLEQV